ncbi:MAG TPA: cyclic nucleotide-binding domain-containing protein [Euzebya sp.]|nr:cyclic nucleotide-binding domain-containing protein [Euzebya sp.]
MTSNASELPETVRSYLAEHETLTLATASPDGTPHATTLMYANDDRVFFVWTRPDTLTARQIDANPRVAFTVDSYSPDWRSTRGVQATAEAAQILSPDSRRTAVAAFEQKFPGIQTLGVEHLVFFKLVVSQVHYIHNRDGGEATQRIGAAFDRDLVYSIFRELPQEEVADIAATLATESFRAGEVIVRQGMPADKFFIIVRGQVDVLHSDAGEERTLNTLGPGQFFGEVAILRDTPRTATVRAADATTVLTMDRDTFRGLVAQSLGTTARIDEIIAERLSAQDS